MLKRSLGENEMCESLFFGSTMSRIYKPDALFFGLNPKKERGQSLLLAF